MDNATQKYSGKGRINPHNKLLDFIPRNAQYQTILAGDLTNVMMTADNHE
jgi:hypothetical protein